MKKLPENRRLRMGMIGGGPGSFIGPVHRIAAQLDGEIELVAGAFSADADRSRQAAESYRLDPLRGYRDIATMIAEEVQREDGIDFVSIVSPNCNHLTAAQLALRAGLPVLSDKPATAFLGEALKLAETVKETNVPYHLTYTYSGYPLVREARERIAAGAIGTIRKVIVEYPQGWLAGPANSKQAEWRLDPERAGEGGCIADVGVHAFHMAEFVSGLRVTDILPDLAAVVPGRRLDDDCSVFLRFDNGARGVLLASQIEIGELNGIRFRMYGDRGGLAWRHEDPNSLTISHLDGRTEILRTGDVALGTDARRATRIGGGHPEGYYEAFANLYLDFAAVLRGADAEMLPGIRDGVRGMTFIHAAVTASKSAAGWTSLEIDKERP